MTRRSNGTKAVEQRLRQRFRSTTSRMLAVFSRRRTVPPVKLDAAAIQQVLVVRMNGRMGNTLFLTPLLNAIHELMPHAVIDVLVGYPDAADLLSGLPGVRNVMTIPHKGWWHVGRSLATLKVYRTHAYDLAIDPMPNSFGGRIALALARARWRLGFAGDEQWLRLDFAAIRPGGVVHDALRPLTLLEQAFAYAVVPGQPRLRLAHSADELADGERLLAQRLRGRMGPVGAGPVIGFFASARGKKDLGVDWWRDFWQAYLALQPEAIPLEVLPTAGHAPIIADSATVHCHSPRKLAATVARMDWFFSADTGPMHLASAAGVPTIAFFDKTNAAKFGPLKPNDTSLQIRSMTARAVAAACAEIVATRSAETKRAAAINTRNGHFPPCERDDRR